MDLPHPDQIDRPVLELAAQPPAVVATFLYRDRAHRLTLPYRMDGGPAFVLASVDHPGPTLEHWAGAAGWSPCRVAWTSPTSLASFEAWCGRAERVATAPPLASPPPPGPSTAAPAARVELADIVPIGRAATRLAQIIASGRPHAITQRGRARAVVVPVELWEALTQRDA